MSVATSRMTIGALFGAITTAANTAANTLDAVNDGVAMLNRTISSASEKQRTEQAYDLELHARNYAFQIAQQAQDFQDQLEDWMDSRPGRKEAFATTLADLQAKAEARLKKTA